MKRIFLLFWLLIIANCMSKPLLAQSENGRPPKVETDGKTKNPDLPLKPVNKLSEKETIDSLKTVISQVCNGTKASPQELGAIEIIIVFLLPVLFFILVFSFVSWAKNDEGFYLSNALSACPPPGTVSEQVNTKNQNSVSRLIAFMTGVVAVVLAVCFSSFYMYYCFAWNGNPPNLETFWKVVASLGIGVVPYSVNQIKEAMQANKPNPPTAQEVPVKK